MKKPRISIIAAISEGKRAIGYRNQLLWDLPNDLKRFKELTSGYHGLKDISLNWQTPRR
jgi:dihydrofolate reductase